MNLVLDIFLAVLCIGVTYSSPTNVSVAVSPKKLVVDPTTTVDHNKVETLQPDVNKVQPAHIPQPAGTSGTNITNHDFAKDEPATGGNKTQLPPISDNKNISTDAKNMSTEVINTSIDAKTMSGGNSSSPIAPHQKNTTTNSSVHTPNPTSTPTQTSAITTTLSTIPSSTAVPISAHAPIADHVIPTPTAQERQFDGPSFVGGIVLTIGLTAIGFIAFKFYKSGNIERNYRTL